MSKNWRATEFSKQCHETQTRICNTELVLFPADLYFGGISSHSNSPTTNSDPLSPESGNQDHHETLLIFKGFMSWFN